MNTLGLLVPDDAEWTIHLREKTLGITRVKRTWLGSRRPSDDHASAVAHAVERFRRHTKQKLIDAVFRPNVTSGRLLAAFLDYTYCDHYSVWAYNPLTKYFTLVSSSFTPAVDYVRYDSPTSTLKDVLDSDSGFISRPTTRSALHSSSLADMRWVSRFMVRTVDCGDEHLRLSCVVSFYSSRHAFGLRPQTVEIIQASLAQQLAIRYSTYLVGYKKLLTQLANIQPGRFNDTLREFVPLLSKDLGYEASSVFLIGPDPSILLCAASYDARGVVATDATYPVESQSMTAEVFRTGQPRFSYDVATDPGNSQRYCEVTNNPAKNWIGVPILYSGRSVGVLRVKNRVEGNNVTQFTAADMAILSNIAAVLGSTHAAEHAFAKEQAQLAQRKKELAQLNDFLKTFRHEVKSPLTFMTTASDRIKHRLRLESLPVPKTIENMLTDLEGIASRLTFVTSQLTFDARELVKDIRTTQLFKEVVAPVYAFAAGHAQRRRKIIDVDKDSLLVDVLCDPMSASMAFHVLIDNAIKYSPVNTRITVTGETKGSVSVVQISSRVDVFKIGDDERTSIFEKYERGKAPRQQNVEGSGIGLYLAREIMRHNAGSVELAFTFTLIGTRFTTSKC